MRQYGMQSLSGSAFALTANDSLRRAAMDIMPANIMYNHKTLTVVQGQLL